MEYHEIKTCQLDYGRITVEIKAYYEHESEKTMAVEPCMKSESAHML